ncbi:hypothetical protein [Herpetosiphon sp. NSE202]|uniref:hypothetical protein n=1 Tax=Herpetosiphon sp. NSE202 TaxID=3351349 RepID=UPI00362BC624
MPLTPYGNPNDAPGKVLGSKLLIILGAILALAGLLLSIFGDLWTGLMLLGAGVSFSCFSVMQSNMPESTRNRNLLLGVGLIAGIVAWLAAIKLVL